MKLPFAKLLEPVHDIGRDPVVHRFPYRADQPASFAGFFSIKIESHKEEQLGHFRFAQSLDWRASEHAIVTDGVSSGAPEKHKAGVVGFDGFGLLLQPCEGQIEERNVPQTQKTAFESEGVFSHSQRVNADVLDAAILPLHLGDAVRPTGGIAIPTHDFVEYVANGSLNSYLVNIQDGVQGDIELQSLQEGLAKVILFSWGVELDQGRNCRAVQKEVVGVLYDANDAIGGGFHVIAPILDRISLPRAPGLRGLPNPRAPHRQGQEYRNPWHQMPIENSASREN